MESKYTKQQFFNEILRVYNKCGYINRKTLKAECNFNINVDFYLSKYNGLRNICNELGIEYTQFSKIKDEDIKNDVLKVYKEIGSISSDIYNKYGKYSFSAIKTHFGFNNLLNELGIPVNVNNNASKDDVVSDVMLVINKYNNNSSTIYRKYGKYSESTIIRLFGSWSDLMNYIGYKPQNKKCGYDYMLKEVKNVFNTYGFISKELISENCDFTYEAFRNYFNNKQELSEALGTKNAFCDSNSCKAKVLYNILKNIFGNIEKEKTWEWLKNPKTNRFLYVDFYIPSINAAVEYDGSQHYKYTPYFHRNDISKYKDQVYRDHLKEKLLNDNKIKLIRFNYKDKLTKINVNERIEEVLAK